LWVSFRFEASELTVEASLSQM